MALSGILWTSTSGLQAVQQQLQWRTDNISNAQNPSYARRDAVTTSTGVDSVQVDVARASDSGLQNQFLTSNSQSSFSTTQLGYFQRIGDVLGTTQSTPYLQQAVDNFTGSWKAFETDTSSTSSEADVVSTGQALADTISHTSQNLDQVESEVRDDVGNSVNGLNAKLKQLDAINKQLSSEPLASSIDPSLLDTRDSLVRDISATVGVVQITHSDNSVALYTNGGVALVDHGANQFQWNSPAGSQPWISLVTTTGAAAPSPSLNSEFTGGSLGAGLGVLDSSPAALASNDPKVGVIVKARAQVDNLAVQLAGQEPGTFGGAYYNATTDRTTDLTGGGTNGAGNPNQSYWGTPPNIVTGSTTNPAPPANWDGTPLSSFFTIDNGTTGPPPTAPTLSPSGSFAINPALVDGTATVKRQSATPVIAAMTDADNSMTAGGVAVSNQTYSGLASAIANYQSTSQAAVSNDSTSNSQTTQTLDTRLNSATGVNMDTEMAQLTVLQNAYAANARVITTVQTMFDALMAIGQ